MIERQLNAKIKQLQSDNNIESQPLEEHLFQNGYLRRLSCPHILYLRISLSTYVIKKWFVNGLLGLC